MSEWHNDFVCEECRQPTDWCLCKDSDDEEYYRSYNKQKAKYEKRYKHGGPRRSQKK